MARPQTTGYKKEAVVPFAAMLTHISYAASCTTSHWIHDFATIGKKLELSDVPLFSSTTPLTIN
jgi:hypothetical protein